MASGREEGERWVHTRVVVYVAGLLVVAALAGVVAWRLLGATSTYENALDTLPRATLRATYTDWAQVRDSAHGTTLGSVSYVSPLARALLGKAVGDVAVVNGAEVEVVGVR